MDPLLPDWPISVILDMERPIPIDRHLDPAQSDNYSNSSRHNRFLRNIYREELVELDNGFTFLDKLVCTKLNSC